MTKSANKKKVLKAVIGILLVLGFLAAILLGAGFAVTRSEKIYPRITIGGIDLGGRTEQEASMLLQQSNWDETHAQNCRIMLLDHNVCETDAIAVGVYPNAAAAARTAFEYGKTESLLENLWCYISCMLKGNDMGELSSELREDSFDQISTACEQYLKEQEVSEPYTIDYEAKELLMRKGLAGLKLDRSAFREQLQKALLEGAQVVSVEALEYNLDMPNFSEIHDVLSASVKNAEFSTDGSHEIYPEVVGVAFEIQDAERCWESTKALEMVRIPVQLTEPEITRDMLEGRLFRDLLGATTTKYNNSPENRCSNVRLAASLINEVVLYPGEEFSFNEIVGARTEATGFLPAPAFSGYDNIKDEIGGGVCQVSSTLYASALFAFLDISAHTCHIYPPNYIQLGVDATVTIPEDGGRTIDFKFINSKNAPIKIVTYCEETEINERPYKTVTVEIWGTLEAEDYMPIEFDNSYINVYDYDRNIEPAYPDREGYIIKFTHEESEFTDDTGKGLRTLTHRKVFDAEGRLVEDRIVNSKYSAGYAMDTYYYRG